MCPEHLCENSAGFSCIVDLQACVFNALFKFCITLRTFVIWHIYILSLPDYEVYHWYCGGGCADSVALFERYGLLTILILLSVNTKYTSFPSPLPLSLPPPIPPSFCPSLCAS